MLPFLYLIIDVIIVLAYIAGPWIILAKLDFAWPDWLKDGIVVVILFRSLGGVCALLCHSDNSLAGFCALGPFV